MRKSYRIKKESEFQKVYQHRNSVANKNFVCYQMKNEKNIHFRVGLSVGKKVGNAVMRNQVKRYIRQSLFEIKDEIPNDLDILIIARPTASTLTMAETKKNIIHVLTVADILQKVKEEENE
jgi:ribonuclease P protein component